MADWRESTWGEEISLEYGKGIRGYLDATGPFKVFGSNGPIGWTSRTLAPGPGVILGRKGAYRGVQFSKEAFFVIDTAYYVVPKKDLDMRWVYYAILYHKLGEIDDGSPIPSTTRAAVYTCELEVPPPGEQRAIVAVLGALDDKIAINNQMNETLGSMTRAIFQSWFVDFDPVVAKSEGRTPVGMSADHAALFPDSLVDSSLGSVPQRWTTRTVADIATRIAIGPFGSRITVDNFVLDGVPVIRGNNLRDGFLDGDFVFLTPAKADELRSANAHACDLVFTHRGTLGQVGMIPPAPKYPRYVVSQSQMLLSVNPSQISPTLVYQYFRSQAGQDALLAYTSTTGVPAIAQPTTSI